MRQVHVDGWRWAGDRSRVGLSSNAPNLMPVYLGCLSVGDRLRSWPHSYPLEASEIGEDHFPFLKFL
jgi:hypothetical protein